MVEENSRARRRRRRRNTQEKLQNYSPPRLSLHGRPEHTLKLLKKVDKSVLRRAGPSTPRTCSKIIRNILLGALVRNCTHQQPNSASFVHSWPDLEQVWPNLVQIWPNLATEWQKFGRSLRMGREHRSKMLPGGCFEEFSNMFGGRVQELTRRRMILE